MVSFQAMNTRSSHGAVFTWDRSGVTQEHGIITVTQITGHQCVSSVKTLIKPTFIAHELIMSVLNYNISVCANLLCATLQLQQHTILTKHWLQSKGYKYVIWLIYTRGAEVVVPANTQFAPEFKPIESQWSAILSWHANLNSAEMVCPAGWHVEWSISWQLRLRKMLLTIISIAVHREVPQYMDMPWFIT